MFCRGPQKCIAEKRIEAKLRLAGENVPLVSFLALRSALKNTLIREMSIQVPSSHLAPADRASHPSMCTCAQVPSSHLAPADRYSALWGIVAFLGESYADFWVCSKIADILAQGQKDSM
ncbi:unnamed protein product [Cladocopium goreaui]|uniref:Uncharacterized protein n=1 Tax=Cladocopium goreaui TaxID=2562237 RepID=A0A9P1C6Q9_9DINO|nr:unnamed protein product [Cladocopium goreaui]